MSCARCSRLVPTPPAEDVVVRHVTPFASPRLAPYVGLAALGLVAALALRRPELVVVAAPFALIVAAGLLFEAPPDLRAWLTIDRDRALEGDEIVAEIELAARTRIDLLELHLIVPRGVAVVDGGNPFSVTLGAGEERTVSAPAPLRPLGLGRARRDSRASAQPDRDARLGGSDQSPASASDLPSPRAPAEPRGTPRHAARDRAISSLACAPTVSSSPTHAPSSPAIAFARSTGGPALAAAS